MKDLDPGRSGRENYNPETEGKPADRTNNPSDNPGGMEGSPSDRGEQGRGQQRPHTDRDRERDQQDRQSGRDRNR